MDNIKKNILYNNDNKEPFLYKLKIKYAIICFVLFIILSNSIFYKVIDLILKQFFHNIEFINDKNEPSFISILISASIFAIIIFLL